MVEVGLPGRKSVRFGGLVEARTCMPEKKKPPGFGVELEAFRWAADMSIVGGGKGVMEEGNGVYAMESRIFLRHWE